MITYSKKTVNTSKVFLPLILIFFSILKIHKSTNKVYLLGMWFPNTSFFFSFNQ